MSKGETAKSNETQEKNAIQRGYSNAKRQRKDVLDSRGMEWRSLWPVAEFSRVPSDADPLGVRRRGTIEDEQHVPAGRGDLLIGRGYDGAIVACASHLGDDVASSHRVTMGTGGSGDKRDLQVCCGTLEELDVDVVGLTVLPIRICDGERGLGPPVGQIRWDVDFNPEFLREFFTAIRKVGLGVGSGDKDATVMEEDRLGVVHASDDGFTQFGETLTGGKSWVIEQGLQVREVRQSETGDTLLSTVQDEECTIGESNHAGHHTAGRLEKESLVGSQGCGSLVQTDHAFNGPCRLRDLGLNADTIIESPLELENVRTTAEEDFQGIGIRVMLREKRGCASEGICATSDVADHGSREIGQNLGRF